MAAAIITVQHKSLLANSYTSSSRPGDANAARFLADVEQLERHLWWAKTLQHDPYKYVSPSTQKESTIPHTLSVCLQGTP